MGLSRYFTLNYPEALVLGIALFYVYWRFARTKNAWRTALVVLAALLVCYPVILHTTKSFDLYVLVDRSRSISAEARSKQQETLELVTRNMHPGDRLGVLSFNSKAFIEHSASPEPVAPKQFEIPYSDDASDLSEALATAIGLSDASRPTRFLVLSDGEYTGRDPLREAQMARQRNLPISYRCLKRSDIFNLMVADADSPDKLVTNEPFRISFNVRANVATQGRYRLYRDGRIIQQSQNEGWTNYSFKPGDNRISFCDSLKNNGIHSYRIEVESTPKDKESVHDDNQAEKFVSVVGEQPILLVNNTGQPDNIASILSAGGLKTHVVDIHSFHMGINQLAAYKGIILNNVAVLKLTPHQIEDLGKFVLEEGGGLLVCGGNNSFGMGGYYRTALEPILPVSLEDRKQSRKVSTAFSVVMDRSGSMAMRTPSGQQKIELADHAAAECVRLLTPADSVSVIPVDSAAHIAVPQSPVTDPGPICSEIKKVESMGGGIFVYTGLLAAGSELVKATQLNKHILLFADAADSEEPGDYVELLKKYENAGITVSVVGLGTEHDCDAAFLKDVARLGKGQIYFTEDASQLIQFFTADTMVYSRNSFVKEATAMQVRPAAYTITPDQNWKDFSCSGFNLLFSKENAEVAIQTADSDQAPILAFWQKGLGRVASLALDTNAEFAAKPNFGDVVLNTSRWILGSEVAENLQIRTRAEGSLGSVMMEVSDQERQQLGEAKLTLYTPKGRTVTKPMIWDGYNRLAASTKLEETGCYRGVIQVGDKVFKTGPLSMPVSPEFSYSRGPEAGRKTLAQLAALTHGKEILDVRQLFERDQRSSVRTPVLLPFLVAMLGLVLLEIAEQRFSMLPALRRWAGTLRLRLPARLPRFSSKPKKAAGRPRKPQRSGDSPVQAEAPAAQMPTAQENVSAPATNDNTSEQEMDYLLKSKSRARQALRQNKRD